MSRRALVGLAFASGLDLAFHIVYRDIGFQMAVESTIGALLGAGVGVAWVAVGRSAMRQPVTALTAEGASSIALA